MAEVNARPASLRNIMLMRNMALQEPLGDSHIKRLHAIARVSSTLLHRLDSGGPQRRVGAEGRCVDDGVALRDAEFFAAGGGVGDVEGGEELVDCGEVAGEELLVGEGAGGGLGDRDVLRGDDFVDVAEGGVSVDCERGCVGGEVY